MFRNRHRVGLLQLPPMWFDGEGGDNPLTPEQKLAAAEAKLEGKNAAVVVRDLMDELFKVKGKNTDLSNRVKDLEKNQVAEGAVVLSEEKDKNAWEWLKSVEGGYEAAKAGLAERDTLKEADAKHTRETLLRKAAGAHKYTNPDAFVELAELKGLKVEEKTEKQEGNDVPVFYVKGEDGKSTRLDEYVNTHEAKWLPALNASGQGSSGNNRGNTARQTVQQTRGQADSAATNPEQQRLDRNRANATRPNPLVPNRQMATKE